MIKIGSEEYEQLINNLSERLTNDTKLIAHGRKLSGKKNKWKGASGFHHQIDASIDNESDALLIECKAWNSDIRGIEFLTMFGRLSDIQANPEYRDVNIRAAIVTTKRWQSGITKLVNYYAETCSVFVVNDEADLVKMIHKHFLKISSIPSEEIFGQPTIFQK